MMQAALNQEYIKDKIELIEKEYEDFAYIVSHDLSAPLRHVKEFTRLLIGGRKEKLSYEEQEYISFLEKSLKKLDDMQEALLTFSRLSTRAGPIRKINCNEIIANALRTLEHKIEATSPIIEYSKLPAINGDAQQIELLFFHLIDNAIKFHDELSTFRKISISALDQGEIWLFEIKDNGIGIPEPHHEEIFKMFRRLNPEEFDGVGAGLAIALKIIRRHGGEILVESTPENGTSVFFSLAKY
jgi:light-regulated signal transduction histidine kinase (bacteriophytochrome)